MTTTPFLPSPPNKNHQRFHPPRTLSCKPLRILWWYTTASLLPLFALVLGAVHGSSATTYRPSSGPPRAQAPFPQSHTPRTPAYTAAVLSHKMASATGTPDRIPVTDNPDATESEPLLGQPGDALQRPNDPMYKNLYSGTGWVAQVGVVLLVAYIWALVFSTSPFIPLFSPHPLLQSLGVLALTQAILVLQPTATAAAKARGARAHAALNLLSLLLFAAGVLLITANKARQGPGSHFHSVHGGLGVAASAALAAQYAVGFAMWGVPAVFGGVDRAKRVWKYHRMSGYLLYALLLATVLSAVYTSFNVSVLHIKPWVVAVSVALVAMGVYPRLHPRKLGINIRKKDSPAAVG